MPFFEPPSESGCRRKSGWFVLIFLAGTGATVVLLARFATDAIT
jgi:hypothetical protein